MTESMGVEACQRKTCVLTNSEAMRGGVSGGGVTEKARD